MCVCLHRLHERRVVAKLFFPLGVGLRELAGVSGGSCGFLFARGRRGCFVKGIIEKLRRVKVFREVAPG